MPTDDPEAVSRQIQSFGKQVADFTNAVGLLGTDKDNGAPLREKLRKIRSVVAQLEGKIDDMVKHAPDDDKTFEQLRQKYQKLRRDFELMNNKAKKLEKGGPMAMNDANSGGGGGPRSSAGTGKEVRIQDIKQVDMSELATEEALQREKLHGALVIESEMRDLHSTYKEFQDLVVHQQTGLDTMSSNITESRKHVEKGVVELKEASGHQKASRKKMCIVIVILVVLIVVVVGILFLSKSI
jgi:syntaxin 7